MDDFCGHTLTDGPDGVEHHEIPDDDAGHVPAVDCGCGPVRDTSTAGHVVYVHHDQGHDQDEPDDWEILTG